MQYVLPADAAGHVWGASLDGDGVLTVVTDSGAWSSRVRYALPEVAARVKAELGRDVVKSLVTVRPRPG